MINYIRAGGLQKCLMVKSRGLLLAAFSKKSVLEHLFHSQSIIQCNDSWMLIAPFVFIQYCIGFNIQCFQTTKYELNIHNEKKSLLDIYTYIDAFWLWPNTIVKGNGLMVLSCSVMWETRSIICLKLAAAAGWLQQPGRQTVVFPPLLEWRWRADRADWARHRHLHFSKLSPQNPGFFLEVLQSGYRYTNTTNHTSLTVSYETDLDIYLSTNAGKHLF